MLWLLVYSSAAWARQGAWALPVTMYLSVNTVRKGLSSSVLSSLVLSPVLYSHFLLHVRFLHIIFWIYEHTCSLLLVLDKLARAYPFSFPVQGNEWACAGGVGYARDLALDFWQGRSKNYYAVFVVLTSKSLQVWSGSWRWNMQSDLPEGVFTEVIAAGKEWRMKKEPEQVLISLFWSTECDLEHRPAGRKELQESISFFQHKITNMYWMDSKDEKFASTCLEGCTKA